MPHVGGKKAPRNYAGAFCGRKQRVVLFRYLVERYSDTVDIVPIRSYTISEFGGPVGRLYQYKVRYAFGYVAGVRTNTLHFVE